VTSVERDLSAGLEHIGYELWMMFEGLAGEASTDAGGPERPNQAQINAWIECYVIHTRNLAAFIAYPDARNQDDICRADFGEVEWSLSAKERRELISLSQKAHKRVAHLTWTRLKLKDQGWDRRYAFAVYQHVVTWADKVLAARPDLDRAKYDHYLACTDGAVQRLRSALAHG
jgi:hypothetical protein